MKHRNLLSLSLGLLLVHFTSVFAATNNNPAFPNHPKMLQFKADTHVMGFLPDKVYLVQTDHALSIEFVGATAVAPHVNTQGAENNAVSLAKLERVDYPNLWDGITARYEADENGIAESVYIVSPGADVNRIRLKYNSQVALLKDGTLSHRLPTKRGWITESKPVAWQEINGKRVNVTVAFAVNSGDVGFLVGSYDKNHTLIIDPVYQWHTYYGSSASYDDAIDIATDGNGNVYVLGVSTLDWDGDGGALALHAHTSGKTIDTLVSTSFVVLKLNSTGAYLWHTFYGANSPSAIDVTANGDVYVTGLSDTWQGDNNASPLHTHSSAGSKTNAFILKLNNAGVYQWHTFYGPVSPVYSFTDITTDNNGNVFISGTSQSIWSGDGDKAPLHPLSTSGLAFCAYVLKLDSSGNYQWHTFYSGPLTITRGEAIAAGPSGDLFISGYTNLTLQVDSDTPPLHAYAENKNNVFILKLNNDGAYQWHTYYGVDLGVIIPDSRYSIAVDSANSAYITGASGLEWQGDGGTAPLHAHSGVASSMGDIYVLKLDNNGAYVWHTFYGAHNGGGDGIAIDGNDNIYITGLTTNGLWLGDDDTPPLRSVNIGSAVFTLELNSDGAYQWHTFYELAASISGTVDSNGNTFITGVSNGAWQSDEGVSPLHANSGGLFPDIAVLKLATGAVPLDTTPSAFALTDQTGVATATVITSNSITISDMNAPAQISITGGEYSVDSGPWVNTSSTVINGQKVQVRLTSSNQASSTTVATLTIGGISDTFSVTTAASTTNNNPTPSSVSSGGGSISLLALIAGIFTAIRVGTRRRRHRKMFAWFH